jgi:hypothetical protein
MHSNTFSKFLLYFSFFTIVFWIISCDDSQQKACTEEFRAIVVTIKNPDDSIAEIDSFFVVRMSDSDTIITHNDTIYQDPFLNGIIIFTDNELDLTTTSGLDFRFTAYKNSEMVVDELYEIRHDECHVELVSGEEIIVLP